MKAADNFVHDFWTTSSHCFLALLTAIVTVLAVEASAEVAVKSISISKSISKSSFRVISKNSASSIVPDQFRAGIYARICMHYWPFWPKLGFFVRGSFGDGHETEQNPQKNSRWEKWGLFHAVPGRNGLKMSAGFLVSSRFLELTRASRSYADLTQDI